MKLSHTSFDVADRFFLLLAAAAACTQPTCCILHQLFDLCDYYFFTENINQVPGDTLLAFEVWAETATCLLPELFNLIGVYIGHCAISDTDIALSRVSFFS